MDAVIQEVSQIDNVMSDAFRDILTDFEQWKAQYCEDGTIVMNASSKAAPTTEDKVDKAEQPNDQGDEDEDNNNKENELGNENGNEEDGDDDAEEDGNVELSAEEMKSEQIGQIVDQLESLVQEAIEKHDAETKHPAAYAELLLAYGSALLELVKSSSKDAAGDTMFGPSVPKTIAVGTSEEDAEDGGEEDADAGPVAGASVQEAGPSKPSAGNEEKAKASKVAASNASEQPANPTTQGEAKLDQVPESAVLANPAPVAPVEAEDTNQDLFELAWEQLEAARVIFEKLGDAKLDRLAYTYEALANFSMENDTFVNAARDYEAARGIQEKLQGPESRIVIALLHSKYLASRRDMPEDALSCLQEAVQVWERRLSKWSDRTSPQYLEEASVLKEMKDEVKAFDAMLETMKNEAMAAMMGGGIGTTQIGFGAGSSSDKTTTVIQVQPKKKRVRPEDVVFPAFDTSDTHKKAKSDI